MKIRKLLLTSFICFCSGYVFAQTFTPRIARDSAAVLTARISVLKSVLKLNELKLSEAEQEVDIEKQKLRIIELRGNEKTATEESDRVADAAKAGRETDMKKVDKLARRASSKSKSLDNAIEKLQKMIFKVEDTHTEIETEERKLLSRDPQIIFAESKGSE